MSLDLSAVGPPTKGLFVFGHLDDGTSQNNPFKIGLARVKDKEDDEEDKKQADKTAKRFPFNPHAEALDTALTLERSQKLVGVIESTGTQSLFGSLGGHLDVFV